MFLYNLKTHFDKLPIKLFQFQTDLAWTMIFMILRQWQSRIKVSTNSDRFSRVMIIVKLLDQGLIQLIKQIWSQNFSSTRIYGVRMKIQGVFLQYAVRKKHQVRADKPKQVDRPTKRLVISSFTKLQSVLVGCRRKISRYFINNEKMP